MKKFSILYVLFFSICFSKQDIYNIKLYGMNVAKCYVEVRDTVIANTDCLNLKYDVHSTSFMKFFFNVVNSYETIIDKNTLNILYFKKNTVQPGINNELETIYNENFVRYQNSDYSINDGEYNIFSLLYFLTKNKNNEFLNELKIDREGKKYLCTIRNDKKDFLYSLNFKPVDVNDMGLIKHTDIFTWALFLNNTEKTIGVNPNNNTIDYCKFKKGLMNFVAKRVETN